MNEENVNMEDYKIDNLRFNDIDESSQEILCLENKDGVNFQVNKDELKTLLCVEAKTVLLVPKEIVKKYNLNNENNLDTYSNYNEIYNEIIENDEMPNDIGGYIDIDELEQDELYLQDYKYLNYGCDFDNANTGNLEKGIYLGNDKVELFDYDKTENIIEVKKLFEDGNAYGTKEFFITKDDEIIKVEKSNYEGEHIPKVFFDLNQDDIDLIENSLNDKFKKLDDITRKIKQRVNQTIEPEAIKVNKSVKDMGKEQVEQEPDNKKSNKRKR